MNRHDSRLLKSRLRRGRAASGKPSEAAVSVARRMPVAGHAAAAAGFRRNEIYASELEALSHAMFEPIDAAARLRAARRCGLSRIGVLGFLAAALAIASMNGAAAQDPVAKTKSTAAAPLPPARPANRRGSNRGVPAAACHDANGSAGLAGSASADLAAGPSARLTARQGARLASKPGRRAFGARGHGTFAGSLAPAHARVRPRMAGDQNCGTCNRQDVARLR